MRSDDRQSRSERLTQRPWFVIVSPLKRALASGAIALVIFWSGGALDVLVTRHYLPRISLMLAGGVIALIVSTLVFRILTDLHTRYAAMLERLERIAFRRAESVICIVDSAALRGRPEMTLSCRGYGRSIPDGIKKLRK